MTRVPLFPLITGCLLYSEGALAQQLGKGAGPDISIVRIIVALVICLAIAGLAIWLLRASKGSGRGPSILQRLRASNASIRVLESRRISLHAEVCMFRCDEWQYLVLVAQGHSRILEKRRVAPAASGPSL